MEFRDHINQLIQLDHTYCNWSKILNCVDANRTEIEKIEPELKNKIYYTLESYRTELSDFPIRREETNPNIYDLLK